MGPRLTALVAYLKGGCHASFSTIRKFLRDVMKITISRGQLAKVIRKVSRALQGVYDDLLYRLPTEACLNVDETGHKENKKRFWTWCFRAELYTLFKIDSSRGSKVLLEVLGEEFNGVLGCDYFSAYRKYAAQPLAATKPNELDLRSTKALNHGDTEVTENCQARGKSLRCLAFLGVSFRLPSWSPSAPWLSLSLLRRCWIWRCKPLMGMNL